MLFLNLYTLNDFCCKYFNSHIRYKIFSIVPNDLQPFFNNCLCVIPKFLCFAMLCIPIR